MEARDGGMVETTQAVEFKVPRWMAQDKGLPTCSYELIEVVRISKSGKAALLKGTPVKRGSEHCHRCGRKIDHPVSRMVGFGPDCCAAIGIPRPGRDEAEVWVQMALEYLSDIVIEEWIPMKYLMDIPLPEPTGGASSSRQSTSDEKPANSPVVEVADGMLAVKFNDAYSNDLKDSFKAIFSNYSDRRWNRDDYSWRVNPSSQDIASLYLWFNDNNFVVTQEAQNLIARGGQQAQEAQTQEERTWGSRKNPRRAILRGGKIYFKFETSDPEFNIVKDEVKRLRGSRFDGAEKVWHAPINLATTPDILRILEIYSFATRDDEDLISQMRGVQDEHERQIAASGSVEASEAWDIEIGVEGLFPFQQAGVEYILNNKRVLVGDQMGLGKTATSLSTLEAGDLYPALYICPASLKLNVKREVEKWLPHRSVEVLNGSKTSGRYDADITIINYDVLSDGWQGKNAVDRKLAKTKGWIEPSVHTRAMLSRDLKAVIVDESHYIKEQSSQRSRAVQMLTKDVEYCILMTGTPVLNRPRELVFPFKVLGRLQEFGTKTAFEKRYCAAFNQRFGQKTIWNNTGASNLDELNRMMRASFYLRRTTDQVIEELPPLRYSDQIVELDNREEYERVEDELLSYVAERAQEDEEFLSMIEDLDPDEAERMAELEGINARRKAERAETLVRLSNLRRVTAEGKLDSSIEWIEQFLASGEPLIVFANHRKVVKAIAKHFNAPMIMGGMNKETIERGKTLFQSGEVDLIVLNIDAGGFGHTLTRAHHVAFVEFPWTPGAYSQAIQRCYGRLNDMHGALVYNVLARDSMDEVMTGMLSAKMSTVDAATDGKASAMSTGFIEKMQSRRERR
jgi:SNF2 family DNA or RNA helicase